jgi:hypothetical protein
VLSEVISPAALPPAMNEHQALLLRLGQAYTAIEAPVGPLGLATLRASTRALVSRSPGDVSYRRIERQLMRLGTKRNTVGGRMRGLLLGAAFGSQPLNVPVARHLIAEARQLLHLASQLAS